MTSSCPGSLTRRPRRRIQAPSTRATRGAISRRARPRCETASFSSGLSSAEVRPASACSSATKKTSYPTAAPPLLADHVPGHRAVHDLDPTRVAERDRAREVGAAALIGDVGELGQEELVVALVRPLLLSAAGRRPSGRRARRACRSGRRRRGRCRRRARAGRCSRSPRAPEQRVPLEGGLVLDRFVVPLDVVDAEHLASGAYSRRSRSISTIFLRLREARKIRHRDRASDCRRVRSAQPFSASPSRASSSTRSNGAASAVPCTSMNLPSPVMTTFMSVSARTSSS